MYDPMFFWRAYAQAYMAWVRSCDAAWSKRSRYGRG